MAACGPCLDLRMEVLEFIFHYGFLMNCTHDIFQDNTLSIYIHANLKDSW